MARFLGIDYGTKRVGVAISDEAGQMAFPFKILVNNRELVDAVHNICGEEEVNEIVIGESMDLSGKENPVMQEIEKFKGELSKLGLPIHLEKEFMTSMHAHGTKGKEVRNARNTVFKKPQKLDATAAALILQRYLDRRNN